MARTKTPKLDAVKYRERIKRTYDEIKSKHGDKATDLIRQRVGASQVGLYVMVGGGMIGRSHAEQPQGAYVDGRASARPYRMSDIEVALEAFIIEVEEAGMDPNNVPMILPFGNMGGVF
jgi:hypothetical protein